MISDTHEHDSNVFSKVSPTIHQHVKHVTNVIGGNRLYISRPSIMSSRCDHGRMFFTQTNTFIVSARDLLPRRLQKQLWASRRGGREKQRCRGTGHSAKCNLAPLDVL